MDLKSKINSWWAKGATKRKIVDPTEEKDLGRQIPNSLHGENQPTICLICDQNFKGIILKKTPLFLYKKSKLMCKGERT